MEAMAGIKYNGDAEKAQGARQTRGKRCRSHEKILLSEFCLHPTACRSYPHIPIHSTMVVSFTEPSTSSAPRKNRRKMSKKAARSDPTAAVSVSNDDGMDLADVSEVPEMEIKAVESGVAPATEEDDELMIDTDPIALAPSAAPTFAPLSASAQRSALKSEIRRVPIPPHRMTPLQKDWINIFGPLTELLGLQVRMNVQRKSVEIRVRVNPVAKCVPDVS